MCKCNKCGVLHGSKGVRDGNIFLLSDMPVGSVRFIGSDTGNTGRVVRVRIDKATGLCGYCRLMAERQSKKAK